MSLRSVFSEAGYLMEKSLGIWLACWAIRHKAKWDYRLSSTAGLTRWGFVGAGYILAVTMPIAALRVTTLLIGLAFLCWPNLAYHLTNLFSQRSMMMVQGRVTSVAYDRSRASLGYSFTYTGTQFGGTTHVKRRVSPDDWAPGQPIDVIFDPANPEKSRVSIR